MTTPSARSNFYRLSRPLLLGIMTSLLGIGSGIVPDFTQPPNSFLNSAARAEEFTDPDLRNYAAALMEIEPIRQSALAQVSKANSGGTLPNLVCNQPSTMDMLNSEAKSLFVKYCNQCESIAASKGLSIDRFNQITQAVRSNPQLQTRVRSFMN
jgi:hypothetical protein